VWQSLARTLDRLHALFLVQGGTFGIRVWEAILCGHKSTPAHFCSELVVYLFESLGLDIARRGEGASFSPDDLRDPTRSWLQTVDVLVEPPEPGPKSREYWDDWDEEMRRIVSESDAALADANSALHSLDSDLRGLLGHERLRYYLIAAGRLGRKGRWRDALDLEAGMDALLEDGYRLGELNLNLNDFRNNLRVGVLGVAQRDVIFQWCSLLQRRLSHDAPLRPAKAAIVRAAIRKLTLADRQHYPAAEEIYQKYL
jgi:hypothetical protein